MRAPRLALAIWAGSMAALPAWGAPAFCGAMQMPPTDLKYVSRGFHGGHAGVDLMAPRGSPIRAAAGGTVVFAGWYFAYGKIVDILHGDGVVTRYAHMQDFAPGTHAGTPVAAGQVIGRVGSTGRANGAHVHFEVRVNGRAVDPKPYLGLARCPGGANPEPILEAMAPEPRRAARPQKQAPQPQPQQKR